MTPLQTVRSGKVAVTVRIAGAEADICVLYFSGEIWYNEYMKSTKNFKTSNPEMVTISGAEYEKLLGQEQQLLVRNERISRLENQIELLMEPCALLGTSGVAGTI